MGREARANLRSLEGGKPRQYVAFQRVLRGIKFFKDDRAGFVQWLAGQPLTDDQWAQCERVWRELHLDTLEESA